MVTLSMQNNSKKISAPLLWYPRLSHVTAEQLANWQISGGGYGIHWPDIDEDLSTEGVLRGTPAPGLQQWLELA